MVSYEMDQVVEVPKNQDDASVKQSITRSLGLHDLYKAAFSQENDSDFDMTIKSELTNVTHLYDSQPEKGVKEDLTGQTDHAFQVYSFKNIPLCTVEITDKDRSHLSYDYNVQDSNITQDAVYVEKNPIILGLNGQFVTNDTVLDLDKGIPVHVVKVNDDTSNTVDIDQFNRTYQGDTQILQRYLNDTAYHVRDDKSEDNIDYFLIKKDVNPEITPASAVGINPDVLGVRYEDCDFNSSDSFASTESIIPKNIQCPKCPKKFMFKSDLLKHDKRKHTFKPKLCCKFCNKEFASQQNLIFHEKSHKKKNNNKCENCKKTFKKAGFLVKHMIKKHSKAILTCIQCSKSFSTDSLLKIHQRKCHPEDVVRLFQCQYCDKVFETKSGLAGHEKTHSEENDCHICNVCGKAFLKMCYLKNHMKSHTNAKEASIYTCEICAKTYKTEALLIEHFRKHTGEKPFKCEICNKCFAYKAYLKIHSKKHADVKPHSCDICEKCFITSTDLIKHKRTHTQEKPFSCTNCNQRFTQQSNLITHWKKQRCGLKMQEEGTQTCDFELQAVDDKILATNCLNMNFNQGQNVNIIVDQSSFNTEQPILLTSIGGFGSTNTIPMIISTNQNLQS